MSDVTPLLTAVDSLADRLRALPQSALRRGAAADGLALARELALRAQRLESPGSEPRQMPDLGVFVVADQVAVAGHDLAEALRTAPVDGGQLLAEALELVAATARRCGGSGRG